MNALGKVTILLYIEIISVHNSSSEYLKCIQKNANSKKMCLIITGVHIHLLNFLLILIKMGKNCGILESRMENPSKVYLYCLLYNIDCRLWTTNKGTKVKKEDSAAHFLPHAKEKIYLTEPILNSVANSNVSSGRSTYNGFQRIKSII